MSMEERVGVGGSEMQRRCRNFVEWIEGNGLIDLCTQGPITLGLAVKWRIPTRLQDWIGFCVMKIGE